MSGENNNITVGRLRNAFQSRYKGSKVKWRARIKKIRGQFLSFGSPEHVIWIFGCQRSGTTFLENIFRHDLNSSVFGEFSELTIGHRKTTLKDNRLIKKVVLSKNAKYTVIRPLYESDNANDLLDLFSGSVGVWCFREPIAVVDSMMRKWGNQFFEISKEVESNTKDYWRLEEKIKFISQSAQGNIAEQYAQFWLLRNKIPFDLGLHKNSKYFFLDYNTLISNPREAIKNIMSKNPNLSIWSNFRADARSPRTRKNVVLDIKPETLKACTELFKKLKQIERNQHQ